MGELKIRPGDLFRENASGGYEYSETLAAGEESDPVFIKPTGRSNTPISVSLAAHTGVGRIEVSISSIKDIKDGNEEWLIWDQGEISGVAVVDVLRGPVTAIKCINVSGTIKFEILI